MVKTRTMTNIDHDIQRVLDWAKDKAQDDSQPPWAYDQYIVLINALQAIEAGRASTITMEHSQQLEEPRAHVHQQLESSDHTNIVPLHLPVVKIQMPM